LNGFYLAESIYYHTIWFMSKGLGGRIAVKIPVSLTERGSKRRLLLSIVLLALGGLASAIFVPVREEGYRLDVHTANAGELTGEALIGQTFVAERDNLAGVGVKFATYSGRENTHDVVFHLRRAVADSEDLRKAQVHPSLLGDNQFYRFDFAPLEDSGGQTYFWFVTSPAGEPGDAVTVDINGEDPYPAGTAYLVRGVAVATANAAVLGRSGKPTVDTTFSLHYSVPAAAAGWHAARDGMRLFIDTWQEQRSEYGVWVMAAGMAAAFVWLIVFVGRISDESIVGDAALLTHPIPPYPRRQIWILLVALFLAAVLVRWLYAVHLPVTNDEGNYLYDAWSILHGRLAGGDGYVKALLAVLWLSFWELLGGPTILAGRLAAITASSLMVFPLYVIGRELTGVRAGILAAGAWALMAAPVVTGIYAHTQPLALLFGAAGVAVLLLAAGETVPILAGRRLATSWWFGIGGMLLGMGAVSRKSVVSLGLIVVWLILVHGGELRRKVRMTVSIGLGFMSVLSALALFAYAAYGPIGVTEALGINSAEDGQEAVEPGQEEQVRAYSIRGMTPFFRESLPLIFLAAVGMGAVLEMFVSRVLSRRSSLPSRSRFSSFSSHRSGRPRGKLLEAILPAGKPLRYWLSKFVWILPLAAFWRARDFFGKYEGESVMAWGMRSWWGWAFVVLTAAAVFIRRPRAGNFFPSLHKDEVDDSRHMLLALMVPLLWLAGMAFLYLNWIKFHANYIIEFLPPLAMLTGIGAAAVFRSMRSGTSIPAPHKGEDDDDIPPIPLLKGSIIVVLLWGAFASGYVAYTFAHTGTFQLSAAREAAAWAQAHIPLDEPIFTGAALIPYLSGHRTALDIAHPRWYAYSFIWQRNPERLAAFLTSREEMLEAYRQAKWFLLEKQTGFSFLMEYSEIEAGLEQDWERVQGISNGSNTMTFYRRRIR